ncbi:MAG TPA: DUF3443 family protein, partial [Vicinamibacterales bacterium]|nr:DUF3443 family protein [Vicinamibacterales bacterium]
MPRLLILGSLLMIAQVSSPQCGSSSTSSTSSGAVANTVAISVNGGPNNDSFNSPFTSVTICVPGTSNCQTIGGIVIDTGSEGLRILSSAVTLQLPQQTAGSSSIVECLPFLDGFTWGPVQTADVKLAGEVASGIPIQLIGQDKFPTIPSGCASQGPSEETLADLDANGILGVGPYAEDCGGGCTFTGASNPGLYYVCPTPSTCQVTPLAVANQVQNPVAHFGSDNNGVVIQLPAVAIGGAPAINGVLTFGIGTQSNNALGSATVLTTDANGNFTTTFRSSSATGFIDTGSNGLYFL